jgi:hypothetical protein
MKLPPKRLSTQKFRHNQKTGVNPGHPSGFTPSGFHLLIVFADLKPPCPKQYPYHPKFILASLVFLPGLHIFNNDFNQMNSGSFEEVLWLQTGFPSRCIFFDASQYFYCTIIST